MIRNEDPNRQSRYFSVTWNNPPDGGGEDLDLLWLALGGPTSPIQYMIAGFEVGPQEGTPHFQIFFHLHPKRRWRIEQAKATLDQYLPGGVWVTGSNWNVEENIKYCKKDGRWKEWGNPAVQRRDPSEDKMSRALHLAQEGELSQIDPAIRIRHYKALKELSEELSEPQRKVDHPTGIWIWGPVNMGKSTVTREAVEHIFGDFYLKNRTKWWDQYAGENVAIWDEANPNDLRSNKEDLKTWADRFSFKPERKGGTIHIRPDIFIVISNWAPWQVFEGIDLEAIMKRFTVAEFNAQYPISKELVVDLIQFTLKPTQPTPQWMLVRPTVLIFTGHPNSHTGPQSPLNAASFGHYKLDANTTYYRAARGHAHGASSNKRAREPEGGGEGTNKRRAIEVDAPEPVPASIPAVPTVDVSAFTHQTRLPWNIGFGGAGGLDEVEPDIVTYRR